MNLISFIHFVGLLIWIFFWVVLILAFVNIWANGYKSSDGIVVAIIVLVFFGYFTVDANTNLRRYTDEFDSAIFIGR
jgi:membrane protein DedA with SNARE-associated domain